MTSSPTISGSSFAADGPDPPSTPQGFVRAALCRAASGAGVILSALNAHVSAFNARAGADLAFLDEEEQSHPAAAAGRRPAACAIASARSWCAARSASAIVVAAPDPARAGDQGLPQRPQGAQLRELRLRPERDRHPVQPALERLLRRLNDPGNLSAAQLRGARSPPTAAPPRASAAGSTRLDTPDELKSAQNELNLAFELRRDALDRDLRPDPDRARRPRAARRGRQRDRRLHAVLPGQRRPLRAGRRRDRHGARGPGHRREGARQRLPARPAALARPARGLDPRSPRSPAASRRPAASTAWRCYQTTVNPAT